jgi:ribonuclease HI
MSDFALFTDVSLEPRLHQGIGGYLLIPASCLSLPPGSLERSFISERLALKRFEETSSTRLEVQTVLWALQECRGRMKGQKLTLYTDSQCIYGLRERRCKLEANAFLSGKTTRPLKNAPLYREFFTLADELGFDVVKVAGHTRALSRDAVEHIFSLIDKDVRKALRASGSASCLPGSHPEE